MSNSNNEFPVLPLPTQPFDDGIIVASCWQSDDPDYEHGMWATVLLLLPTPNRHYVVEDIKPSPLTDGSGYEWYPIEGTVANYDNIIPAAEAYSESIGGY